MEKISTFWERNRARARDRLDMCEKCENYDKEHSICGICHCNMIAKTIWPSAQCPLNKWEDPQKES